MIVRADADLEQAAGLGVQSITFNAGQGCALTTRHLVHRSVLAEYHERVGPCCSSRRSATPPNRARRWVR